MADEDFIRELREGARTLLSEACDSTWRHRFVDGESAIDRNLWKVVSDLGWPMLAVPEVHGGLGAGIEEAAVLQREVGRTLSAVPTLGSLVVARGLTIWPGAGARDVLLPKIASGELLCSAPMTGTAVSLAATATEDGWTVSGDCEGVLDGVEADLFVLPVQSEGKNGLAFVRRGDGMKTSRLPAADRTRSLATVSCDHAFVDREMVVIGSAAVPVIDRLRDDSLVLIAADAIGGAEVALEMTLEYLKTRIQFGKPIGSFQALKHRAADHKTRLETATRLLERALRTGDNPPERSLWAAMAKMRSCDAFVTIAADMVQLHGGIGYTWEHDAHLYLKRAQLDRFLLGGASAVADQVADLLLASAA